MSKKDVGKFSSEELYELAKQRELEERDAAKSAVREEIGALRAERKKVLVRHRKELADIDAQIKALGGRSRGGSSRGAQTGISEAVVKILAGKTADTKTIRAKLEKLGINTANLGQTLAYLKRTGRIQSEGRGLYSAA